jgi:hypothetical protein
MKKLKLFNGRGHGRKYQKGHFYVAAYSQKQAAELVGKAAGFVGSIGVSEIAQYYHKNSWGNTMDGIEPTEPCVYGVERIWGDKPKRIV